MGAVLLLILSAIFPVAVFLFIVYKADTVKEPPKLLAKCFFFGCLATIPILIIELGLGLLNVFDSHFLTSFYEAFIVASLTEEGVKFLVLYWIVWKRKEFDQYYDGIVYAVFVSLGFALVENILYVIQSGFGVAVARALLSVPGHGLFGVMMGYFFARARFSPENKRKFLWLSLLIPILFHGLYDFILFYLPAIEDPIVMLLFGLCFVALIVLLWVYGIKNIRKHYKKDFYYIHESKKAQQTISFYPIQPGVYDRMIMVKNSSEEFLVRRITEYGALHWAMNAQMHGFRIAKSGDWFVIRVADSVSFYSYHQLVGWLSSNEYAIGLADHKTDPTCDYLFNLDPSRPFRDTEIGVFRNGVAFFIFLPEANQMYGNMTLTGAIKLSWDGVVGNIYSNGHDIARNDFLVYNDYSIRMNV